MNGIALKIQKLSFNGCKIVSQINLKKQMHKEKKDEK
jgi:hypothetical protein